MKVKVYMEKNNIYSKCYIKQFIYNKGLTESAEYGP